MRYPDMNITNLAAYTPLQIAHEAIERLLDQGCLAYDRELAACRYRTLNGRACVVGGLIPDDVYDEAIEGDNALSVAVSFGLDADSEQVEVLNMLQTIHDGIDGGVFDDIGRLPQALMLRQTHTCIDAFSARKVVDRVLDNIITALELAQSSDPASPAA